MSRNDYKCVRCSRYVLDDLDYFCLCIRCHSADEALIGDRDRDNAIARLNAAHADGYLSAERLDERVTALLQPDITKGTLKKATAGLPSAGSVIIMGKARPWWKRPSFALALLALGLFALVLAGI